MHSRQGRAALRAGVEIRTGFRVTRVRPAAARFRIEGGGEVKSARACLLPRQGPPTHPPEIVATTALDEKQERS